MADFSSNDALSQFLAVGQRSTAGGAVDSFSLLDSKTGTIVNNGPGPSDSSKQTFDFAQGVIGSLTPAIASVANTLITTQAAKDIAKQSYKPGLFGTTLPSQPAPASSGMSTTTKLALGGVALGGLYLLFRKRGRR